MAIEIISNSSERKIGLTGGIATGKTTVANYLAEKYNLPILDADIYAREAVAIGSPILDAIFERYGDCAPRTVRANPAVYPLGNRLKLPDGSLNRSALGDIIFNNLAEKEWLESQIHPYVRDRFILALKQQKNNTIVLSIPLLFEAHLTDLVTEIWVVACDQKQQLTRLQQRDRLTTAQAQARIDSQLPLSAKIAQADVVLNNNSDLQTLFAQIDRAFLTTKS